MMADFARITQSVPQIRGIGRNKSIRRIVLPSCQKDDTHRHYDDNQQGQNYLPVRLLQIEELTDHITPN